MGLRQSGLEESGVKLEVGVVVPLDSVVGGFGGFGAGRHVMVLCLRATFIYIWLNIRDT